MGKGLLAFQGTCWINSTGNSRWEISPTDSEGQSPSAWCSSGVKVSASVHRAGRRSAAGWKNDLEFIVEKLAFFWTGTQTGCWIFCFKLSLILLVLIWCVTANTAGFCTSLALLPAFAPSLFQAGLFHVPGILSSIFCRWAWLWHHTEQECPIPGSVPGLVGQS